MNHDRSSSVSRLASTRVAGFAAYGQRTAEEAIQAWDALRDLLIERRFGTPEELPSFANELVSAEGRPNPCWRCCLCPGSRQCDRELPIVFQIVRKCGRQSSSSSALRPFRYHAILNVSYFMFANFGSHYAPRVAALIIPSVAAIVTVVWGPQTLARYSASPGGR